MLCSLTVVSTTLGNKWQIPNSYSYIYVDEIEAAAQAASWLTKWSNEVSNNQYSSVITVQKKSLLLQWLLGVTTENNINWMDTLLAIV